MKRFSLISLCIASAICGNSFAAPKLVSLGDGNNSVARAGSLRIKPVEFKVEDEKTLVVNELPNETESTRMVVLPGNIVKGNKKITSSLKQKTPESKEITEGPIATADVAINAKNYNRFDDEKQDKLMDSKYIYVIDHNHIDVDVENLSNALKKLIVGKVELRRDKDNIEWRYNVSGNEKWNKLIAVSELGSPTVQMGYQNDVIVWKYSDDEDWQTLLSLSDLPCPSCVVEQKATLPDFSNYKNGGYNQKQMSLDDEQWQALSKVADDDNAKFIVEYQPVDDGYRPDFTHKVLVDENELSALRTQVQELKAAYDALLKERDTTTSAQAK